MLGELGMCMLGGCGWEPSSGDSGIEMQGGGWVQVVRGMWYEDYVCPSVCFQCGGGEGSVLRAPVAVVAVATWPVLVMTRWSLAYVLL